VKSAQAGIESGPRDAGEPPPEGGEPDSAAVRRETTGPPAKSDGSLLTPEEMEALLADEPLPGAPESEQEGEPS
jgi:hypothetical protein